MLEDVGQPGGVLRVRVERLVGQSLLQRIRERFRGRGRSAVAAVVQHVLGGGTGRDGTLPAAVGAQRGGGRDRLKTAGVQDPDRVEQGAFGVRHEDDYAPVRARAPHRRSGAVLSVPSEGAARYDEAVISIPLRALRLLLACGPALLACHLAGWLARFLLLELASTVGAGSALAAFLILPLAALARLVAYVGMFFVLREALLDRPATPRAFGNAVLASILPFFAFYTAWGMLGDDVRFYAERALEKIDWFTDGTSTGGAVLELRAEFATIAIVVVAFLAKFLLKRFRDRLPRWTNLLAVYLEALWVYLSFAFVADLLGKVTGWIDNRQAVHWVADLRTAVGDFFGPLGVAWDSVGVILGLIGAALLLPLAWLTIAGVIYGRGLAPKAVELTVVDPRIERAKERLATVPQQVLRRVSDLGVDFIARFRPVTNALVLIWRAGPAPMGVYVFCFALVSVASTWLLLGVTRLIGPQNVTEFWLNFDTLLAFGADVLIEPIRISLVAAAYAFCVTRVGAELAEKKAAEEDAAAEGDAADSVDAAPTGSATP